ncbi:MAG: hypothetical protein M1812_007869 [Candelaria pacifica]|nr:MAG: hypothetical protein M1812_007869 [Candelaria pacifica]
MVLVKDNAVGPITTVPMDAHANVTAKTPVLCMKHAVRFNAATPDATRSASNPVHHVLKVLKAHLSFEKPSAFSVEDHQFRYKFLKAESLIALFQKRFWRLDSPHNGTVVLRVFMSLRDIFDSRTCHRVACLVGNVLPLSILMLLARLLESSGNSANG